MELAGHRRQRVGHQPTAQGHRRGVEHPGPQRIVLQPERASQLATGTDAGGMIGHASLFLARNAGGQSLTYIMGTRTCDNNLTNDC